MPASVWHVSLWPPPRPRHRVAPTASSHCDRPYRAAVLDSKHQGPVGHGIWRVQAPLAAGPVPGHVAGPGSGSKPVDASHASRVRPRHLWGSALCSQASPSPSQIKTRRERRGCRVGGLPGRDLAVPTRPQPARRVGPNGVAAPWWSGCQRESHVVLPRCCCCTTYYRRASNRGNGRNSAVLAGSPFAARLGQGGSPVPIGYRRALERTGQAG